MGCGRVGGAAQTSAPAPVDQISAFTENMTVGSGFIVLAALVFGRWNPIAPAAVGKPYRKE